MLGQRGFLSGLLMGAVGTIALLTLSPVTRQHMRPVLQAVIDQMVSAGQRLQRSVYQLQEDVEDLVAEARQSAGDGHVSADGFRYGDTGREGWS